MKYLRQKIKAGVINLKTIPMDQLIQMAMETPNDSDRDILGCEIMYRRKEDKNG